MSIDLSQFHQVFFEESYEGLDVMEQGLLDMDTQQLDDETINAIFRAAHSIKGGAGTFGFSAVAEFTHVVETLLDEIRSGKRQMTQTIVSLLLQSVDCLRDLMGQLQQGSKPDATLSKQLKAQFEVLLQGGDLGETASAQVKPAAVSAPAAAASGGDTNEPAQWHIKFVPEPGILQTGNEPTRMFRQLKELAADDYQVTVHCEKLPALTALNPESCYLWWEITLPGRIDKAEIVEVFEWVIDDAEVIISAVGESVVAEAVPVAPAPLAAPQPEPAKVAPAAVKRADEQAAAPAAKAAVNSESSSIRVSIDKVDSLINMVGELVITQSMLGQLGTDFDMTRVQRLQEGLAQLEHNTRELQESVMKIRMMPISFIFSRFPRLVRDVSQQLGKKIELHMGGENTELDKTVMEKIGDPLVHLIRNAVDHGIEIPEKRRASGKSETGHVHLNAFHQSGNIVIEIRDDGNGLNTEKILSKAKQKGLVPEDANLTKEQIADLIFLPGFSTADQVSDLSGRGVGMDVVRKNIMALNGTVEVHTEANKGTSFTIRLPLTLAILDGQLVKVGEQIFIFPLVSIVESIQHEGTAVNNVAGGSNVLRLRDEYVPIIPLNSVFSIPESERSHDESIIVVVESEGEKIGVVVDELLGQQQVVIKSLEQNYKKVDGISGATILGDGTVALIIDISGLSRMTDMSLKHIEPNHQAA
ncbi:MAG: chemotaxis protein CheA [Oceanospirillaceae bacterium]|nr:chemotaxis protein CheA [Oceanospirillaceae bacterium]MCP5350082.1 chemotaxis protein CheA [Oceanospirillaceae bacterium]